MSHSSSLCMDVNSNQLQCRNNTIKGEQMNQDDRQYWDNSYYEGQQKQQRSHWQQLQQRQNGNCTLEWRPEKLLPHSKLTVEIMQTHIPVGSGAVSGYATMSRSSITQGDKVAQRNGPMQTIPPQFLQPESKLTTLALAKIGEKLVSKSSMPKFCLTMDHSANTEELKRPSGQCQPALI